MHARKSMAKGFTLVEILIVVVILGILAAIVIPQFTNASQSAKASSLLSQLQTIRSQVELYKNQHNGEEPDLDTSWDQFTLYTDIDGNTNATSTTVFAYGPYMQKASVNPFNGESSVGGTFGTDVADTGGVETDGWIWDGEVIKACVPATIATEQQLDATDVCTYIPS